MQNPNTPANYGGLSFCYTEAKLRKLPTLPPLPHNEIKPDWLVAAEQFQRSVLNRTKLY